MSDLQANEIGRLVEKAELTRYIHASLAERRAIARKLLQMIVAILGMLVSILAAVYFRSRGGQGITMEPLWQELILFGLIVLPAFSTAMVVVDATVFRLRDQEEVHKSAVGIWGNWIRKADEVRRRNSEMASSQQLQKSYRKLHERSAEYIDKNVSQIQTKMDSVQEQIHTAR